MMSVNRALTNMRLVRSSRRGFCPACRLLLSEDATHGSSDIAKPALAVAATLVAAGGAWAYIVVQAGSMSGMAMGLGPWESFAGIWIVMMAAMMLPTAVPLFFEFARVSEGRQAWPVATSLLIVTYLAVWLAFGLVCYGLYTALRMPWPNQSWVSGLALALAGLYALTPVKRASQARCRELCALHGPLPFNLMRSAVIAGVRYGVSCIGCSAGLMVAMVLFGMANLVWAVMLAAAVLIYKVAPLPWRYDFVLSLAFSAAGIAFAVLA